MADPLRRQRLVRWRSLPSPLTNQFQSAPQLLLQPIVPHPLDRCQITGQLLLLRLRRVESLTLDREQRVGERGNMILIGCHARLQLPPDLAPHLALVVRQPSPLHGEPLVRLPQSLHLLIGQLKALPYDLLEALAHALLEELPAGCRGG